VDGATGTFINQDGGCKGVLRTSLGIYEVELLNAMGVEECCATVTASYAPPAVAVLAVSAAGLRADGITVEIQLTVAGLKVDCDFCLVVERFAP